MAISSTVLFDVPQKEVASMVSSRMRSATSISIVTGFATPGGIAMVSSALHPAPARLATFVVGAATYPAFEALDELRALGVPGDRLRVHLGHTRPTGTINHPFARHRPMMHSKIYFMEQPGGRACAFVGSNNVTMYALGGLNGEAAVLLEGPSGSAGFDQVRRHVAAVAAQAVVYDPAQKDGYTWWAREYFEGVSLDCKVPSDIQTVRTIIVLAEAAGGDRPVRGDSVYFEIPAGIEQLTDLGTEAHLFLFDTLPADPWAALYSAAAARYRCKVLGVENRQGNIELTAQWRVDPAPSTLVRVPGGRYHPATGPGMQQVRVEVLPSGLSKYEYFFERARQGWDPEYSADADTWLRDPPGETAASELDGRGRRDEPWKLVAALVARSGAAPERDQAPLSRASPDSGAFILVSLRRRRPGRDAR